MIKKLRYLLFPFSILYGIGVGFRNFLYDKNILRSAAFNFPVICVGNLSVGGTGKTPFVEYLIELMGKDKKIATLSRGYKRKTKGFAIADKNTTSLEIGDEPMQIWLKYPQVTVAVAEERIIGIPQILHESPESDLIILDDAFQHRPVRAGLNILLTAWPQIYPKDFLLPAGNLRDMKGSSKRADMIIVTKCKPELSEAEKNRLVKEINPLSHQSVYFTKIKYGRPYRMGAPAIANVPSPSTTVLLVCGIANPDPLKEKLDEMVENWEGMYFRDHHIFDSSDLKEIRTRFEAINSADKIIITTEKDAVRMNKFKDAIVDLPVYVMPMEHCFLFDEAADFNQKVINFVENFSTE